MEVGSAKATKVALGVFVRIVAKALKESGSELEPIQSSTHSIDRRSNNCYSSDCRKTRGVGQASDASCSKSEARAMILATPSSSHQLQMIVGAYEVAITSTWGFGIKALFERALGWETP